MSEASDNDDESSSDEENGLFGNMMKTMFKENDMKKEFIYQYNIPCITLIQQETQDIIHNNNNNNDDNNNNNNNNNNEKQQQQYKEITIKLNGIHESYGQTAEKTGYTLWQAAIKLANNMVKLNNNGGLFNYFTSSSIITNNNNNNNTQSIIINNNMANKNTNRNAIKILELGAGLGLCGILASKLMILTENNNANIHHIPTINVVITDGDTKVLNGIQDNILLNTINNTTTTTSSFKNNNMIAMKLRWGLEYIDDFIKHIPNDFIHKCKTNGRRTIQSHDKYFNIIMGSDIIYDENIIPSLFDTGKYIIYI